MGLSYETREKLALVGLLIAGLVPFIPISGSSLYTWMSQYTVDTIGPYTTGYVLTFLICWIICLLPMLVWTLVTDRWFQRANVKRPELAESLSRMPTLDDLRVTFHAGMNKDDFFAACDLLLERFGGLRIGTPSASETLISIAVAEGDVVLFFLTDDELGYAEYKGGIFLGE